MSPKPHIEPLSTGIVLSIMSIFICRTHIKVSALCIYLTVAVDRCPFSAVWQAESKTTFGPLIDECYTQDCLAAILL